ncbi:MAG: hypothetical protein ABSF71_19765 [Terriglobia bacterium]|jgi:hypothetical protein
MCKLIPRLNLVAICLLAGVLAAVLVRVLAAQMRPQSAAVAALAKEHDWVWSKTLQVCPTQRGDPVKLVRIIKDGKEVVPGVYPLPDIVGDHFLHPNPLDDWLKDTLLVVRNQSSKNIVSIGIAFVFPARQTNSDCRYLVTNKWSPSDPFCDANPGWCEGGCPVLLEKSSHWGFVPAVAASGLEARYLADDRRPEGRRESPVGALLQGKEWLRIGPGQETALSAAGRGDGWTTMTIPKHPFTDNIDGILAHEGIEEAQDTEPCALRANSETGCAFAKVSKFNIGIVVVYFEDGTIWGNFGYGYAQPGPDGIFTRIGTHETTEGAVVTPPAN